VREITGLPQKLAQKIARLFLLFALSACSYHDLSPDFPTQAKSMQAESFSCCADPEKFYPDPIARLGLIWGDTIGAELAQAAYGDYDDGEYPGKLTGKTDAHERITALLRPLDLLVISNKSYFLGRLMPGQFSHSLIYVGTEAQLRAAGLWSLPEIVPYHDQIRAGNIYLEAATPEVQLTSIAKAYEVDKVVAMRPTLSGADKRQAITRIFASLGKPFNYSMDLDPSHDSFVCTGLIDYAMPGLDLTRRELYGRTTILPDDLASQAIRGDKLDVITYVIGTDEGYTRRSTFALMVDIAAYWGVPTPDQSE
jgi:hypothetical protein